MNDRSAQQLFSNVKRGGRQQPPPYIFPKHRDTNPNQLTYLLNAFISKS
jgi:hypothetical protein